jgi:hypothetical protein
MELPAERTPIEVGELLVLFRGAWESYLSEVPKKESLLVLLAQWALETGHGKSVWNHNLGNVKATVTGLSDYCFFACNEILSTKRAEQYQSASPSTAKITKRAGDKCVIWFYPKHPACCFRAFTTIELGVVDHFNTMCRRFASAWPFVVKGDPAGFSHALKLAGYYTADEREYTKNVASIFNAYSRRFPDPPKIDRTATCFDWSSAFAFPESAVVEPEDKDESPIYSPFSMQLQEQALL